MAYASRYSSYLLGSVGAVLQVVAGWWDVYSHLLFGSVDPWWNPAHLTLYAGVAIVILAVWRGVRAAPPLPLVSLSPIRFVNVAGLKLAGLGSIMQVIAGIWNEIVHHMFLSEPKIAPAHALLTLGMLTINLGMVIGLTIEYGMIKYGIIVASSFRRRAMLVCLLIVFASIWLAAAGPFVYAARVFRGTPLNWISAVLLALVGTLVLVPAKRVLPRFGSVLVIGVFFNCVAFIFLVAYAGTPAYIPWGLLPLAMFDLLALALNRIVKSARAVLLSSTVTGLFFWATYYPFTLYLFPWSFSPIPTALLIAGSFAGALLGNGIYAALSSVVLPDTTA